MTSSCAIASEYHLCSAAMVLVEKSSCKGGSRPEFASLCIDSRRRTTEDSNTTLIVVYVCLGCVQVGNSLTRAPPDHDAAPGRLFHISLQNEVLAALRSKLDLPFLRL